MFNSQLTGLIEAKDTKLALLKEYASQVKAKYQVSKAHCLCWWCKGLEVAPHRQLLTVLTVVPLLCPAGT